MIKGISNLLSKIVAILVLQNLYTANVRNVVVMGLAPLGCAPYYLWLYESENGECVEMINDMIVEFNYAMRYMVENSTTSLKGPTLSSAMHLKAQWT